MALGDITLYSKDNGNGYPGDVNYLVGTATTVPQILAGEPVSKLLGTGVGATLQYAVSLASGTGSTAWPVTTTLATGTGNVYIMGVAATTSNEATSGNQMGQVSVAPIDEPLTYLISTLQTAAYFGAYATGTGALTNQQVYDSMVGSRVTFTRTGGVGSAQLGGTYTINATDSINNGLIVEELDIARFPGKVRFSFRNGLSYRS